MKKQITQKEINECSQMIKKAITNENVDFFEDNFRQYILDLIGTFPLDLYALIAENNSIESFDHLIYPAIIKLGFKKIKTSEEIFGVKINYERVIEQCDIAEIVERYKKSITDIMDKSNSSFAFLMATNNDALRTFETYESNIMPELKRRGLVVPTSADIFNVKIKVNIIE